MTIRIKPSAVRVKHPPALDLVPGPLYAFDDPDAEPYFIACGWAEEAEPKEGETVIRYSVDEVDIDACTVWADGPRKGGFVMPERAAAVRGTTIEEAEAFRWAGESREQLNTRQGDTSDG